MAIVANILPIDTLTVGKRVAWFDPTSDLAGLKLGEIVAVRWNVAASVVEVDIKPDGGGANITNVDGNLVRVIDKFTDLRPNV